MPTKAQINAAAKSKEDERHRALADDKKRDEELKKRDEVRDALATPLTSQLHEAKTKQAVREAVAEALQTKDSAALRQASDQVRCRFVDRADDQLARATSSMDAHFRRPPCTPAPQTPYPASLPWSTGLGFGGGLGSGFGNPLTRGSVDDWCETTHASAVSATDWAGRWAARWGSARA